MKKHFKQHQLKYLIGILLILIIGFLYVKNKYNVKEYHYDFSDIEYVLLLEKDIPFDPSNSHQENENIKIKIEHEDLNGLLEKINENLDSKPFLQNEFNPQSTMWLYEQDQLLFIISVGSIDNPLIKVSMADDDNLAKEPYYRTNTEFLKYYYNFVNQLRQKKIEP